MLVILGSAAASGVGCLVSRQSANIGAVWVSDVRNTLLDEGRLLRGGKVVLRSVGDLLESVLVRVNSCPMRGKEAW